MQKKTIKMFWIWAINLSVQKQNILNFQERVYLPASKEFVTQWETCNKTNMLLLKKRMVEFEEFLSWTWTACSLQCLLLSNTIIKGKYLQQKNLLWQGSGKDRRGFLTACILSFLCLPIRAPFFFVMDKIY